MHHSSYPISGLALPSRYDLLFQLASGGTATVHLGRLTGIAGFWRLVAIKVAHAHLTADPLYREMMVEEASLASKIHHPNVVPVIDIADAGGKLLLVMEYIEGASLSELVFPGAPMSPRVAVRIALDACAGLHAAHALCDATGRSLNLVHRDVSPQNILVGTDGVARLTDFGIAKTASGKGRSAVGTLKGKLGYMAPEYVLGTPANAQSDVFGLGVVVWEILAGRRLFRGENGHETLCNVLQKEAPKLSAVAPHLGEHLDAVIDAALSKSPDSRHRSAKAFGAALEAAALRADMIATAEEVGAFVLGRVGDKLTERRRHIGAAVAAAQDAQETPSPLSISDREEITRRERALVSSSPPPPRAEEETAREGRPSPPPDTEPPPTSSEIREVLPRPPRMPLAAPLDEIEPGSEGVLALPARRPARLDHGQSAAAPNGAAEAPFDEITAASRDAPPPPDRAPALRSAPPALRSEPPDSRSRWSRGRTWRAAALVLSFALGGIVKLVWFPEVSSATSPRPAAASPAPADR